MTLSNLPPRKLTLPKKSTEMLPPSSSPGGGMRVMPSSSRSTTITAIHLLRLMDRLTMIILIIPQATVHHTAGPLTMKDLLTRQSTN